MIINEKDRIAVDNIGKHFAKSLCDALSAIKPTTPELKALDNAVDTSPIHFFHFALDVAQLIFNVNVKDMEFPVSNALDYYVQFVENVIRNDTVFERRVCVLNSDQRLVLFWACITRVISTLISSKSYCEIDENALNQIKREASDLKLKIAYHDLGTAEKAGDLFGSGMPL